MHRLNDDRIVALQAKNVASCALISRVPAEELVTHIIFNLFALCLPVWLVIKGRERVWSMTNFLRMRISCAKR